MHGFARDSAWDARVGGPQRGRRRAGALSTADSPATRAIWPHRFHMRLDGAQRGAALAIELAVTNTGPRPSPSRPRCTRTCACATCGRCSVRGLQGCAIATRTCDGTTLRKPRRSSSSIARSTASIAAFRQRSKCASRIACSRCTPKARPTPSSGIPVRRTARGRRRSRPRCLPVDAVRRGCHREQGTCACAGRDLARHADFDRPPVTRRDIS